MAVLRDQLEVLAGHRLQLVRRQLGIELHPRTLAGRLQDLLELVERHLEHDVAVHLNQPPVAVTHEAGVTAALDHPVDDLVVETQIEDRVHHSRHRHRAAGAHRQQHGVGPIAELLAVQLLEPSELVVELLAHARRVGVAIPVVVLAGLGGDREPGRNRYSQAAHLGQAGALAPQ